MGKIAKYTRRTFLGLGVLAAGGLAVGYYYYRRPYPNPLPAGAAADEVVFSPWLKIATDNEITVIAPRAEMGQGTRTTLAALVAEELDVPLDMVRVEHGPASSAYYNRAMFEEGGPFPFFDDGLMAEAARATMGVVARFLGMQVTGGSSAMKDAYVKMRQAGAAARHVLVAAAAERWGVDPDDLRTGNGAISHPSAGQKLTYGEVATAAGAMTPPDGPALKPRSQWTILGRPQDRVEGREKVTGAPIFAIDVELPDMLHATVKISPRFGAGARSVDKTKALAVPGVRDVVEVETTTGRGFGIVAENTWAAFRGAEALEVEWEEARYPADDAGMQTALDEAMAADADFSMGGEGDVEAALADAPTGEILEATYDVPYLAHATMEPMNATARLRNGKLEVWVGSQAPGIVKMTCASLLDIETDAVTVHTTFMGGGFGRRAEADAALYAAALAAKTDGRPVKVTWSREEDMRHDAYRPIARGRMRARVSQGAGLTALDVKIASPSVLQSVMARTFPSLSPMGPEKVVLEGTFDQPLTVPNRRYRAALADISVPVGFWRSVGHSFTGFFHECFLDEAAEKAGADPLAFRLALMNRDEHRPAREVLKKAADMAGWGTPLPEGRGRGMAHMLSYGTWVAQVVEVDASGDGIRIDRVCCAADPGIVLDPRNFEAQMISGIVFGLSQALGQQISFANGEVVEGNFDAYDAMRMRQCPRIEVALLENSPRMGGAGEPGTPPAAAALANAIYAATGKRIRRMPLSKEIAFA